MKSALSSQAPAARAPTSAGEGETAGAPPAQARKHQQKQNSRQARHGFPPPPPTCHILPLIRVAECKKATRIGTITSGARSGPCSPAAPSSPAPPPPPSPRPPSCARRSIWRAYPFSLGVAAGEPAADGFVIWTRLAPEPLDLHGGMAMAPMPVKWEVASDDGLRDDRRAGRGAGPARARPQRPCRADRPRSPTGPIGTASRPAASAASTAGRAPCPLAARQRRKRCSSASPAARITRTAIIPPTAISRARSSPSSIIMATISTSIAAMPTRPSRSGSLIVGGPRRASARTLYDLGDYRQRYAPVQVAIPTCSAPTPPMPSSTPSTIMRSPTIGCRTSTPTAPPAELFRTRRAMALQAWYEHMPVRRAMMPRFGAVGAAPRGALRRPRRDRHPRHPPVPHRPALRRRLQAGLRRGDGAATRRCSARSRRPG